MEEKENVSRLANAIVVTALLNLVATAILGVVALALIVF